MFGIEEELALCGADTEAILDAAMALYVPHGMAPEAARDNLREKLGKAFRDPNISSLLLGAMLLENRLCRNEGAIHGDPVYLLSDEIIGMAIAEYIGGTCARFEFTRYDQKKPGILSHLGPFLDDAVAGLIAGCTSRLYTECC
jgi:alpha-ribazole phosphatase CobZ